MKYSLRSLMSDLLGFGAFFATGAAIGVAVALSRIDKGEPAIVAVCAGAFWGGVGGWFVFFAGIRLLEFAGIIKKPELTNSQAPSPKSPKKQAGPDVDP